MTGPQGADRRRDGLLGLRGQSTSVGQVSRRAVTPAWPLTPFFPGQLVMCDVFWSGDLLGPPGSVFAAVPWPVIGGRGDRAEFEDRSASAREPTRQGRRFCYQGVGQSAAIQRAWCSFSRRLVAGRRRGAVMFWAASVLRSDLHSYGASPWGWKSRREQERGGSSRDLVRPFGGYLPTAPSSWFSATAP